MLSYKRKEHAGEKRMRKEYSESLAQHSKEGEEILVCGRLK
jgi:hypothetical protein